MHLFTKHLYDDPNKSTFAGYLSKLGQLELNIDIELNVFEIVFLINNWGWTALTYFGVQILSCIPLGDHKAASFAWGEECPWSRHL